MKIFCTDNDTEYVNSEFDAYFSNYGIIQQTTCLGTSEKNGLAERNNRYIFGNDKVFDYGYECS